MSEQSANWKGDMMREITTHHVEGAATTRVFVLDDPDESAGGMCHKYSVQWGEQTPRSPLMSNGISFQHGPIKEAGHNGLTNETLLAVVIDRLQCAQRGPFACDENAFALSSIYSGLCHLKERTKRRVAQGVEGTNQKKREHDA